MLDSEFYFDKLKESDYENIVSVVYQAHLHGYTSTVVGPPDINNVADALERRYVAFTKTNTLGFSTIIKRRKSPVITLGVMDGNPAKELYTKLGFIAGCGYSDYLLGYDE